MESLFINIACSALFIIGIITYIVFAVRKSNRDYEYMMKSEEEHAKWLVNFGRMVESFDKTRR